VAVDLVERFSAAAAAAIANVRPDLERDQASIRALHVELELDGRGQLGGCETYVQRHLTPREMFGSKRAR
jgi:hypothetical protein